MRTLNQTRDNRSRAFTLAELLVVMGVLVILAVLTTVSVRAIAKDARLSSGTNIVKSALGNARALAMKENRPVLVTFRVRWDPDEPSTPQRTEVVLARSTGEFILQDPVNPAWTAERYEPVPDVPVRELPVGIKIGGPRTDFAGQDDVWITLPEVNAGEVGRAIGVLFGPDGSMLTRDPSSLATANSYIFVDICPGDCDNDADPQDIWGTTGGARYWMYDDHRDESNINFVQFLAVYDDTAARELYDVDDWFDENTRRADMTEFISEYANRVHFNRYTGVVLK